MLGAWTDGPPWPPSPCRPRKGPRNPVVVHHRDPRPSVCTRCGFHSGRPSPGCSSVIKLAGSGRNFDILMPKRASKQAFLAPTAGMQVGLPPPPSPQIQDAMLENCKHVKHCGVARFTLLKICRRTVSWSTMEEFLFVDGMSLESDMRVLRAILQVRRQYRRDGEIAKARHSTV